MNRQPIENREPRMGPLPVPQGADRQPAPFRGTRRGNRLPAPNIHERHIQENILGLSVRATSPPRRLMPRLRPSLKGGTCLARWHTLAPGCLTAEGAGATIPCCCPFIVTARATQLRARAARLNIRWSRCWHAKHVQREGERTLTHPLNGKARQCLHPPFWEGRAQRGEGELRIHSIY
jgi:hypothetical protein